MAITVNIDSQVLPFANLAAFPATGVVKTIYIAKDTDKAYYWDSAYIEISGGASGGTWGSITGTLSNQTDLQTALDGKFDDPTGTTAQYIDGTGALQTFPDSVSIVKHAVKAGEALTKGQAVYVSSADGTNMIVTKASNTTDGLSSKTMGLITTNLANNAHGYVITEGLLTGLNTNSATIGDPVWLGTNGNLLYGVANKPYAPAHLVYIGIVTRVNTNNGEIFVRVQNGFEVEELHNVSALNPNNGDSLVYNTSNSLWEATTTKIEVLHAWDSINSYDYMGVAKFGTATSATTWTITRIIVANDGTTTSGKATGAWDNRASLTYV